MDSKILTFMSQAGECQKKQKQKNKTKQKQENTGHAPPTKMEIGYLYGLIKNTFKYPPPPQKKKTNKKTNPSNKRKNHPKVGNPRVIAGNAEGEYLRLTKWYCDGYRALPRQASVAVRQWLGLVDPVSVSFD